jgi:RNA polymerase sigma-70 factor (ECF subfamily)
MFQERWRSDTPSEEADELFRLHSRRIYAFCYAQLGSREEAEDALQVTFLRVYRALENGEHPDEPLAWIYRIARNVCLDRVRSAARRRRVEEPGELEDVPSQADVPESREHAQALRRALRTLPRRQRRAIVLREWRGFSYTEIAADLGITRPAVEMLVFRARKTLAEALRAEGASTSRARGFSLDSLFAGLKSLLAQNAAGLATGLAVVATATTVASGGSLLRSDAPQEPRRAEAAQTSGAPFDGMSLVVAQALDVRWAAIRRPAAPVEKAVEKAAAKPAAGAPGEQPAAAASGDPVSTGTPGAPPSQDGRSDIAVAGGAPASDEPSAGGTPSTEARENDAPPQRKKPVDVVEEVVEDAQESVETVVEEVAETVDETVDDVVPNLPVEEIVPPLPTPPPAPVPPPVVPPAPELPQPPLGG